MDSTTRYLIIILLIIVFLVLSPLIVLYVTGRTLPFLDPAPTNTGIIDVQTLPERATVYLEDKEVGSSPATVRFVRQGWHNLRVETEGYRTWQKRLFIQSGEVTYAGSVNDAIRLLPESSPELVTDGLTAYASAHNQIVFAKDAEISVYDLNDQKVIRSKAVSQSIVEFRPTGKREFIFAKQANNQWALLNTETFELTTLPGQLAASSSLSLLGNDTIVGLANQNLIATTLGSLQTRTLQSKVSAFLIRDNNFYILGNTGQVNEIAIYNWDGANLVKQFLILDKGVPNLPNMTLHLTNQKELFLLAGGSFYRVNQELELLKNSVTAVDLDQASQRLTFITPTEIYYYNFTSNRAELLARTTENLSSAVVLPLFGYGFIAGPSGTEAIEIDNRGNQNRYRLSSEPASKIFIAQDEEHLVFISHNRLFSLEIKK